METPHVEETSYVEENASGTRARSTRIRLAIYSSMIMAMIIYIIVV